MGSRYDSYCGLYCGACEALLATERGQLEALAESLKMQPAELRCRGCKTSVRSGWCLRCVIRGCAAERGLRYCWECGCYPCPTLVQFRDDSSPHHSAVLAHSERMRDAGVDEWLKEQAHRWRCPSCRCRFSWYEGVCAGCGAELYSCEDEERDLLSGGDSGHR